jgi:hypothetical protein
LKPKADASWWVLLLAFMRPTSLPADCDSRRQSMTVHIQGTVYGDGKGINRSLKDLDAARMLNASALRHLIA